MQHGTVQEPGNRTEYFAGILSLKDKSQSYSSVFDHDQL